MLITEYMEGGDLYHAIASDSTGRFSWYRYVAKHSMPCLLLQHKHSLHNCSDWDFKMYPIGVNRLWVCESVPVSGC